MGVSRVLRADPSGRAFLQALAEIAQRVLGRSNFFESLKSQRRLKLLSELLESVCNLTRDELADPLSQYEALKDFDHNAPLNRGVVSDQLVSGSAGVMVRRITYHCPIDGTVFKLLTNEMTLPPGLVVLIYKMRWDVEKAFDETKNRWRERKSWASSATAKTIQARLVCLTHNLALLMEQRLEEEHAICNAPENQRRDKRLTKIEGQQAEKGAPLPQWYRDVQRATLRGVKFIRWLGNHLFLEVPWERALASLRRIYSLK